MFSLAETSYIKILKLFSTIFHNLGKNINSNVVFKVKSVFSILFLEIITEIKKNLFTRFTIRNAYKLMLRKT